MMRNYWYDRKTLQRATECMLNSFEIGQSRFIIMDSQN